MTETKDKKISIRVTAAEHEHIFKIVGSLKYRITVTEYIRHALLEQIERDIAELKGKD